MALWNASVVQLPLVGTAIVVWRYLKQDIACAGRKVCDQVASDYHDVQSLTGFVWNETEPLQLRPWKPKFHLSMGLERLSFSEFLPIDRTLTDRLALRRRIIAEHGNMVVGANEIVKPAVKEFYTWLVGTYLPGRYPEIYNRGSGALHGPEPGIVIPLEPPADVKDALRIIAKNVDVELFFLQREGESYVTRAFIDCYPFAFDPRHKMNKTVAQIHAPVPRFKPKLQKSIDRYFASLPKGKIVKRHNWNVALDSDLYSPAGNPLTYLPTSLMIKIKNLLEFLYIQVPKMTKEDVDPNKVTVRCERQTLHRLMENDQTLVFAFKTYQYPLRQLHEEGNGEGLAEAIIGIKGGSVIQLDWYKASVYWGDAVAEFLRS